MSAAWTVITHLALGGEETVGPLGEVATALQAQPRQLRLERVRAHGLGQGGRSCVLLQVHAARHTALSVGT